MISKPQFDPCQVHSMRREAPPGTGKTMLAKRVPSILPLMSVEEALETTKIHSIAGALPPRQALVTRCPFRSPHHTVSDAGRRKCCMRAYK
ncbi:MAG: ATP-binding protein [Verrucomicrobia bacterium]|nr:ATP-binding protein [Verrucomicrobiota bacterium]MBU1736162.1 ATP-binding protein [Verrucomicrobiota bacterium]MBU1856762.1 ATP-binding protein [Verrucomicrobiota bacterium]